LVKLIWSTGGRSESGTHNGDFCYNISMPTATLERTEIESTKQERYANMLRLPIAQANRVKLLAKEYGLTYNGMLNILVREALDAREK